MTTELQTISDAITQQGQAFAEFAKKQDSRFAQIEREFDELTKRANRPTNPAAAGDAADFDPRKSFAIDIDGRKIPMLRKQDNWADYAGDAKSDFDLAEYVRDCMIGSRKAATGPALVTDALSMRIIDDVRRATTIVQAGASTIPIDGPTVLAKVTGDPTVHQHTEGEDDIGESDITLAPVKLDPKMLVALIPLTQEVVMDSPNLNQVLSLGIAAAFGQKVDALSLATILADEAVPTSAAGQDPALWAKCLEAVGAAMAVNQPVPSAMIGSTADFIARASQLASTAGTWLGKPPVLQNMAELPTTGVDAGTAIYGGFPLGFAVAFRQELRFEVVRWAKASRGTHVLVAHMRADGVVLQPKRLFVQQKTVD